ncbi:hypothetical protein [Nafulsella turpanensis]|uniref:hypothetical protein n=1 Tax=Nafulsella turpanensis TaxID=1265690 RepID=UPI000365D1F5|nr:hypothetical protein [Nafulsella turpanensis]
MPNYKLIKSEVLLAPVDLNKLEALLRAYEKPNNFSFELTIEPFGSMLLVTLKVPSFAITGLRAALYNLNKSRNEKFIK